jgi:hypothetical protein
MSVDTRYDAFKFVRQCNWVKQLGCFGKHKIWKYQMFNQGFFNKEIIMETSGLSKTIIMTDSTSSAIR